MRATLCITVGLLQVVTHAVRLDTLNLAQAEWGFSLPSLPISLPVSLPSLTDVAKQAANQVGAGDMVNKTMSTVNQASQMVDVAKSGDVSKIEGAAV